MLFIVYLSFIIASLSKLTIYSMIYGHRLSFIKEWFAKRVDKEAYEEVLYDVTDDALGHIDAIGAFAELYDKLAVDSKTITLLSCEYCLSGFASFLLSLVLILAYGAPITVTAELLAINHVILLIINKFLE